MEAVTHIPLQNALGEPWPREKLLALRTSDQVLTQLEEVLLKRVIDLYQRQADLMELWTRGHPAGMSLNEWNQHVYRTVEWERVK